MMVGKRFKGLTDELLRWQMQELLERETGRSGSRRAAAAGARSRDRLDCVQSSTRCPGGVALRFARVKRVRPDDSPAEGDTIEDLWALLVSQP